MDVTKPADVADLRLRHAQLRGLSDETVVAKAEDFERAIRIRYGVTATDSDAEAQAALKHVIIAYFPWWLLWSDRVESETAGSTSYSRSVGELPWPEQIGVDLGAVAVTGVTDQRPRASSSTAATVVW